MSDMKKISGAISLIILALLTFTGCRKDNGMSSKQIILFQYDYYKNSGDPAHNGFFIDNKGNVMTYNNPENWNNQDELTEEQVMENMRKCTLSPVKIADEELSRHIKYITNLASSKVSARRSVSAGTGTARFLCYEYSETTGTYKTFLIKMEGEYTCENLNFYSKKTASWLRDVGNATGEAIIIENK